MADERFQDFPQKTNPTGSDELVGVDGSGYFRSPVSSLPSSGGVAVEDEGSSVESAASTLNFVGDGVTATDEGSGQVDITIPAGASISSLNAANVLEGDEILPAEQLGTGVKITTRWSRATTFDAAGTDFSATDKGLFGSEAILCRIANSGAITSFEAGPFQWGNAKLDTGSSSGGYAGVASTLIPFYVAETVVMEMGFSAEGTVIPTETESSTVKMGWLNPIGSGSYEQGIYFESNWTEPNWICVVKRSGAGTRTEVDSGIPVRAFSAVTPMYKFRVHYDGPTDTATFFVDAVLVGTIVNVLDGGSLNPTVNIGMQIEKDAGNTPHALICDAMCFDADLDTGMRDIMP
jgi:hypothetical protein